MQSILAGRKEKDVEPHELSLDNLEAALANDNKVKLAGVDIDGMLLHFRTRCHADLDRNASR